MTTFLTFSVYSINTSNSIPMQSEYLPAVTVFFLLSILFALVSLSWFIIENYFRAHKKMPAPVKFYVKILRKIEGWLRSLLRKIKSLTKKKVKPQEKSEANSVEARPNDQVRQFFIIRSLNLSF
jgi:hypothetical protein